MYLDEAVPDKPEVADELSMTFDTGRFPRHLSSYAKSTFLNTCCRACAGPGYQGHDTVRTTIELEAYAATVLLVAAVEASPVSVTTVMTLAKAGMCMDYETAVLCLQLLEGVAVVRPAWSDCCTAMCLLLRLHQLSSDIAEFIEPIRGDDDRWESLVRLFKRTRADSWQSAVRQALGGQAGAIGGVKAFDEFWRDLTHAVRGA